MVSMNEMAEIVLSFEDKKLPIHHIPGPEGVRGRNSDNTLIKEKLGWAPSMKLKVPFTHIFLLINFHFLSNNGTHHYSCPALFHTSGWVENHIFLDQGAAQEGESSGYRFVQLWVVQSCRDAGSSPAWFSSCCWWQRRKLKRQTLLRVGAGFLVYCIFMTGLNSISVQVQSISIWQPYYALY